MVAKGGAKLIDNNAIKLLKSELVKKVLIVTPNIPEAEVLTNVKIKDIDEKSAIASIIAAENGANILRVHNVAKLSNKLEN